MNVLAPDLESKFHLDGVEEIDLVKINNLLNMSCTMRSLSDESQQIKANKIVRKIRYTLSLFKNFIIIIIYHSHDLTRTCFPGMYWVLSC